MLGQLGNMFGWADGLPSANWTPPIFNAPLTTTLVPLSAKGSGTPTFTRATPKYVADWEGKLNLLLSGEAGFQGTRRVENKIFYAAGYGTTSSEVISLANGWAKGGGTSVSFSGANPTVITCLEADSTFNPPTTNSIFTVGHQYRVTVDMTLVSGTTTFIIRDYSTVVYTSFSMQIGVRKKYTTNVFTATATNYATFGGGDATTVYNIYSIMVEDVTGQSNQNPAEYVSVGVLSAPYHGAGVDGVKYFSTQNGNTVASNVIAEATGAAISSATLLGYNAEAAATNEILQANTLGTTWTISDAADMNAVVANQYVSNDGTTTMDQLKPKNTTAVHSLDQAYTFTAAKYTCAVDLRYVPATPQRWVAIVLNDGTSTWAASFDLLNGVAGAVSSAGGGFAAATSTITASPYQANVYRVTVTNTANAAAAAGTVKISLNATDTATLESALRAGTETLGAGMVQLELGSIATSPITTTTVAVTRNRDLLSYPLTGNASFVVGSLYAEAAARWAENIGDVVYIGDGGLSSDVTGSTLPYPHLNMWDGTNEVEVGPWLTTGVVQKTAGSWGGSTMTTCLSGTCVAGSFDGALGTGTEIYIGTEAGPGFDWNGTIRNVRIYGQALSAAQLQAMTT